MKKMVLCFTSLLKSELLSLNWETSGKEIVEGERNKKKN
jgi:hypothetical protein